MVSIIISAYQNDRFLIEAINSVVKSAKNIEFEILLGVDNCKTTMNGLINKKNLLPKNLKIFYFPKVGTYVIRNSLANIASYENLIFFDSDDIMNDVTIEETVKALRNNDIAKFKYLLFYNNFDWNKISTYQKSKSYHYGCFAIRKSSFLSLNGFEPWICAADGEFKWRTEANGFRIVGIEKPGFFYRRHNTNLTVQGNTGMNSPIRKHYHKIRDEKAKNNQKQKLDVLYTINYLPVDIQNISDYEKNFSQLKIHNPYSSNNLEEIIKSGFGQTKAQTSEKIKKVFQGVQKQVSVINYDRVNQTQQNKIDRNSAPQIKLDKLKARAANNWKDHFSNVQKKF